MTRIISVILFATCLPLNGMAGDLTVKDGKLAAGCGDALFAPVNEGRQVAIGPFSPEIMNSHRVVILGSGLAGGNVYRLIPRRGGPARVIKSYNEQRSLENDLKAFEEMRRWFKDTDIRLPWFKRLSPTQMELEDIRGTDAQTVMYSLPPEKRGAIKSRYDQLARMFLQGVDSAAPELLGGEEQDGGAVYRNYIVDGHRVYLSLRPSNFVIESGTGQWILIDPN
ncbi:MAG TPA: hypothetical protein PKC28_05015 [Bdellovibrionales bacterium]|nr:hypothetical protein [Bdellovibrionales bacterium]